MNTGIVNGGPLTAEQSTRVEEHLGLVGLYLKKVSSVPAQPMTRCEYDAPFQTPMRPQERRFSGHFSTALVPMTPTPAWR